MRAMYYTDFGGPLQVRTLPDPEPAPDGAVIRVMATGLCRSDWHGWLGHDPDICLPHVPGHEFAGIVTALGSEVTGWQPGDRVTVPFCCGCGRCVQCRAGNQHICDAHFQPGFTAWGSFAEQVAIRHAGHNLVALPEAIDFATAASLGCRFVTAWRAIRDQGRARPGEWVAIFGCGGVGLSAVMIAAALGARVVAVDVNAAALQLAADAGAEHGIDARRMADLPGSIRELTGGGAHLSLDALGSAETCRQSILSLRKQGRHLQVGLLPGGDTPVPMDQVIARELELLGSHGLQVQRYPAVLAAILAGDLAPQKLIAQTLTLEEAALALTNMGNDTHHGVTLIDPAG